uniref:Cytochrome P450 n=1 Tax=Acrobeloides nanus TaxID=290746 RepID=A0A914CXD4_9BILA
MMIQSMREFLLGILKKNPNIEDDNPDDVIQVILANMLNPKTEHNEDLNNNLSKDLSNFDQGVAPFEKISQFFVSILSGQDATAYAMQMIIYVLAKIPEIQNKVRTEINEVMGDREEVEFEDIPNLKYLYQVIQETLRMYPTNPR